MNSIWIGAAGLTGLLFGVALGMLFTSRLRGGGRKAKALEAELAQLEQRFKDYRQQVTQHFLTTSELVQKMSDSYRDVYEHLAGGSQTLCQTKLDKPGEPPPDTQQLPESERVDTEASDETRASKSPQPAAADLNADEGLGDAPRVPELDIHEPVPKAGPGTPASASPRKNDL